MERPTSATRVFGAIVHRLEEEREADLVRYLEAKCPMPDLHVTAPCNVLGTA